MLIVLSQGAKKRIADTIDKANMAVRKSINVGWKIDRYDDEGEAWLIAQGLLNAPVETTNYDALANELMQEDEAKETVVTQTASFKGRHRVKKANEYLETLTTVDDVIAAIADESNEKILQFANELINNF